MTYDNRYRPTENKLVKDSPLTTHADYTYQEDGVGNITQVTDALDATFNRVFEYDDLNRLTTANSGTSLWGTAGGNGYAYDAMGNITALTLGTSRTASFTYSGTLPKLTSVTETGPGTRNVTYDLTGNETMVGAGTFAYSARNYLSTGDGLTYTYDGRGLRTIVVNSDATPAKRYSFYSPEMNLLSESALTTDAAPTIQYDYIWFNGHPVGQINGGTQWTFTDHLGAPWIQTNSTGDVFWRAEYEPYGRVFSLRTPNQHQSLRLPGQESEELNLSTDGNGASERFYNIFRWYRYGWGRYTQGDPVEAPDSHPFAYVALNPLRWIDPLGLHHRGDVIIRCDPTFPASCDVSFVWDDPTPDDDNNGDTVVIGYGPPNKCPAGCPGTAHLTLLNGGGDPYAGWPVQCTWTPKSRAKDKAYESRWETWRKDNPPWVPAGGKGGKQCYDLVNQMTDKGDYFWDFPLRLPRDLRWWTKQCKGAPRTQ